MGGLLQREDIGVQGGARDGPAPIPNPHLAETSCPRRKSPNSRHYWDPATTGLAPISSSVSPGTARWHRFRVLEAPGTPLPQQTGSNAYITIYPTKPLQNSGSVPRGPPDLYKTRVWCRETSIHLRNAARIQTSPPHKQIAARKACGGEVYSRYMSLRRTRRAAICT